MLDIPALFCYTLFIERSFNKNKHTMIIVTGASGQLGRGIVKELLKRVPADQIGVSVRDPEKVQDLKELGVRVRQGDFEDPASLIQSFEGVTQLLLVSSNAASRGGDPLAQHRTAIDAALTAGAERIVYTSHMAASHTSAFPPMRDHAATEEMLRQSGLAWTALRNGFYASSGLMLLGDALKTGVIEAPADGKVSWTAHDDLAKAAAVILSSPAQFEGLTPPLTGSQSLDLADMAEMASALQAQSVRRDVITDDALRAKMTARGVPAPVVEIALGLYLASRNGEFAAIDPTLERLLGHSPIPLRDLLARKIGG